MHPQRSPKSVSGHVRLVEGKRGSKWFVKYRLGDGRQVKRKLGPAWTGRGRCPAGYFTKRTAEEALAAILADARRGVLPHSNRSGATFEDAAMEFLRYKRDVRQVDAATLADYKGVVVGYLIPEFGQMPVESITAEKIDAYKERLIEGTPLSNRSVVRHLNVLHGIFKRARRAFGLNENPAGADVVERPPVVYTGEFDTFEGEEVERLAAAAENDQDAALYRVAAYAGLRQGELFALRWRCVDFVGGLIHVRRNFTHGEEKVPKGKKARSVPMTPDVIDPLARLKDTTRWSGDDDLVFPNVIGEFEQHDRMRRRFWSALEKADLRKIKFHDLRHAFGTAAVQHLGEAAVQGYMGHSDVRTTQRYLHHKPRPQDAALIAAGFGRGDVDQNQVPKRVPTSGTSTGTGQNSENFPAPEDAEQTATTQP